MIKGGLHFLFVHLIERQGWNQLFISGGQFWWNFIRWRHRVYSTVVQLFRKRSQIKFSSQHFLKWELFSFRPNDQHRVKI